MAKQITVGGDDKIYAGETRQCCKFMGSGNTCVFTHEEIYNCVGRSNYA